MVMVRVSYFSDLVMNCLIWTFRVNFYMRLYKSEDSLRSHHSSHAGKAFSFLLLRSIIVISFCSWITTASKFTLTFVFFSFFTILLSTRPGSENRPALSFYLCWETVVAVFALTCLDYLSGV